jgi:hypothetical protein
MFKTMTLARLVAGSAVALAAMAFVAAPGNATGGSNAGDVWLTNA